MHSFYRPHARVHPDISGESMTKQSFKDECDIHNILSQYKRTGIIAHISAHNPRFEDVPDNLDYQSSLDFIMSAQDNFDRLPAAMRAEYGNDPGAFLKALQDPANFKRFQDLGIFKPDRIPVPPDPLSATPPPISPAPEPK